MIEIEDQRLLVESPMFRFECCEHCRTPRCPRHDGHPAPCSDDPISGGHTRCVGSTMLGEPPRSIRPALVAAAGERNE